MKFCGIDLHSNNCVGVITDEMDKVIVSRRCRNQLDTVLALLTPYQAELAGVGRGVHLPRVLAGRWSEGCRL